MAQLGVVNMWSVLCPVVTAVGLWTRSSGTQEIAVGAAKAAAPPAAAAHKTSWSDQQYQAIGDTDRRAILRGPLGRHEHDAVGTACSDAPQQS